MEPKEKCQDEITTEMVDAAMTALADYPLVWEFASPESIEAALKAALRVYRAAQAIKGI